MVATGQEFLRGDTSSVVLRGRTLTGPEGKRGVFVNTSVKEGEIILAGKVSLEALNKSNRTRKLRG